ncbi:MAG TPA: DUF6399 domain-containing protein [Candidatus Saccharimonadia bacterium]|nr:DUF6399 domain-containing protein [Candidatus Saccharimonadia bacterium]
MRFWEKSLRIFKCLCDHGGQGVRSIALQTGLSKSSVHRLRQAMERRDVHPESWLWETAEGRQWLTRLVVATLYTFGLKRGVGVDTMSAFFTRVHLDTQVGCSPCALRQVMQALAETAGKAAETWEQDASTTGEVREIIGGVDETFLERMLVILQDLPTGYLVLEDIADDRTFPTWKALVDERLKALGAEVLYLVSDRAKALIQLAEKGLECLSMPDFFHVAHEIVKSYSLALGQRLRQAHKELKQAQEALARLPVRPPGEAADSAAKALVEARQAEVTHWAEVQHTYRHHLETLSLTLHPFHIADSAPQTSAQVASQLQATVEEIEAFAQRHQLPTRREAMTKVRKQVPALAALVDFWWQGVQQDLEPFILSPLWRSWVHACLLPLVYWEHQAAHTRCARRKAKIRQALEAVQATFQAHAITKQLALPVLEEWKTWATQRTKAFQRTSSSVEGRNGYLSQMHHNHRGLPRQRYKVWTVLHNFDCHAADGTTPAARFFGRAFPDLFETVLARLDALPQPRRRTHPVALSP